MRFLVDQNLPASLAARLEGEGHDALHTRDLGMEQSPDEDIFEWYRTNEAILHTADKRLTKYVAEQHATNPSVVVFRGYLLDVTRLEADLLSDLDAILDIVANEGHAVFSIGPDRPTRAQLLPLVP